jgi:hypothetical protein
LSSIATSGPIAFGPRLTHEEFTREPQQALAGRLCGGAFLDLATLLVRGWGLSEKDR